jgi:hypothetical protein
VAYDTTVQVLATPDVSARYGGHTQSFDADFRLAVIGRGQLSAGFSRQDATYDDRIISSSYENTENVKYEVMRTKWVTLHSKFEHGERRGRGLDTTDLVADGEQPGLRTFDIADRNRDLGTLVGAITPTGNVMISLSAGGGRDEYPNSQFGLFNARHRTYSLGFDASPGYKSLQWSRQANPGVQQNDPTRDWSTNGHDRVHSALASLDVLKIANRINVKLSYDFSNGNTLYLYGGAGASITVDRTLPEGSTIVPSSLPAPTQLPPVTGRLMRGTLDVSYPITAHAEIGLAYWYEQYRVSDFALDAQAIPQIDLPSALLIGYQYLPYTAHTVFARVSVRW